MSENMKNAQPCFPMGGFIDYCGLQIIDYGDGKSEVRVEIDENKVNPYGIAHGGIVFTVMDTAAGAAERFRGGVERRLVTQCADIHYMKPGMKGTVTARGKSLHSGKKTAVVEVNAYDCEENLIARATFEMFFL